MHRNSFQCEWPENTSIVLERVSRVRRPSRPGSRALGRRSFRACATTVAAQVIFGALVFGVGTAARGSEAEDKRILADLDTKYQKAVEQNDAKTMAEILADGFILVEGDGKKSTKADLVNDAKSGQTHYERQEDSERTIAVSGDTAVITAKLHAKGMEDGAKVDYYMWFSDVYIRTPKGWRYFYAQASLPLPGATR
jgi:ketosteroid isomerase-like protein